MGPVNQRVCRSQATGAGTSMDRTRLHHSGVITCCWRCVDWLFVVRTVVSTDDREGRQGNECTRTVGGQYAWMAWMASAALASALSPPLGSDPWPARPLHTTSHTAMPFSPLL